MAERAGQERQYDKGDPAADERSNRACFHAVGAFLIHGLQQQESVERKPIGMLALRDPAYGETDGGDKAQPQRETHLKRIEAQAGSFAPLLPAPAQAGA